MQCAQLLHPPAEEKKGSGNPQETGSGRQVMHRFEPRTANTGCAHLKDILTCQSAKQSDELEATFMRVEGHMKQYEALSSQRLS